MRAATSHNTANNDASFVDKDYCGRSIVALRVLVDKAFLSSRHNGAVCRDCLGATQLSEKSPAATKDTMPGMEILSFVPVLHGLARAFDLKQDYTRAKATYEAALGQVKGVLIRSEIGFGQLTSQ